MGSNKTQKLLEAMADPILHALTWSYSGAYAYHTVNPIRIIKDNQDDTAKLIRALAQFRNTKSEELVFVSRAAALSAAAVIGVFSWPTTESTVWAAKMLWNWSFFMSCFALISSAHQRLLRHLPKWDEQIGKEDLDYDLEKIPVALNLFLKPATQPGCATKQRLISMRMLWVWQCPTMLMSYSWVFFLVGYALYILSPVFDPSQGEVSWRVATVTVCGCALVVLNFSFCAALCQLRLRKGGVPSEV